MGPGPPAGDAAAMVGTASPREQPARAKPLMSLMRLRWTFMRPPWGSWETRARYVRPEVRSTHFYRPECVVLHKRRVTIAPVQLPFLEQLTPEEASELRARAVFRHF